jgi:RNA polymerase sigma factor (sigma-70 family)
MMADVKKISLSDILSRLAKSRADMDAWQLLYLQMWPLVVSWNYRLLGGSRQVAEDASQEVFLRLLKYSTFDKLQQPNAFLSYLRTVCRNVSRDCLNDLRRRREAGLEQQSIQLWRSSGLPRAEDAEITESYGRVLAELNHEDRELIELAVLGYTLHEIAEATGLKYNNAAVRIHRIRKRIRKMLMQPKGKK